MMEHSGEPLQRKLAATRHWWRLTRVLSGLTWVLSIVVALALICYHSDRLIVLSSHARETWRTSIALTAVLTLLLALLQPLLRRLSDVTLAMDVERRFPILHERLLTTLDLAPAMNGSAHSSPAANGKPYASPFSEQMTSALTQETHQVSSNLNFMRAVSLRPLRNGVLTLAFTLFLLFLHVVFAREAFATWLRRMSDPRADIAPYARTRVQIIPDATLLARGDGTTVTVKTWGDPVDHCVLRVHQEGDSDKTWTNLDLSRPTPIANANPDEKDARTFRYHFSALPHSIALVAAANDGRSNERTVLVEDRPTLLNVKLALHFPAYMHRKDQILPETTGAIAAPFGTQVDVVGVANKPLKSALFVRDNTAVGNWPVRGLQTTGHIGVSKDGTYRLKLVDTHGFSNLNPARYEIRAIKDEAPTVQILRPATDIDLVPGGSLPLMAHATDDYGISTAKLVYSKTHEDSLRTGRDSITNAGGGAFTLPAEYGTQQVDIHQRWFIGSVSPKVGDTIRYEVDGYDNDNLSGPHIGRSLAYRIRVVSVVEKQQHLKELLDAEQQALAIARQHQLEAQKQVEQARTKADPAQLARAQEAQRNVAQETKAVAQRIQDLSNELENNNFATKSELERRQQAQQTLENSVQQKMNPAADKVQQAQNAKANSSERNQELQQADQQQTQAKQDIERAQELLQRTATADQLAKTAQQLAQDQNHLAESARSLAEDIKQQQQQNKTEELAQEHKTALQMQQRQQAQVNADTRKLEKGLEKAAQEAQERGDTKQAEELKRASDALKQGDAKGNQNQAQQNLSQNKPQQAAPAQDKAAAALQKAAESAAKAADQNAPADPKTAAEKAEAAAQQLHELAKQQADVAKQVGQNPDSQQSKDLAQKEQQIQQQAQQAQQNLEGAKSAQQSAQKAQQNLSQSGQKLSQNQPQGAKQPAQDAAKQLEDAAKQAERAAQQLRQQQQAQELADKVERLAQIQHGLENATKRLDQNKAGLTADEIRERRKVAGQQHTLEQQANELAQKVPSKAFQQALKMAAGQMHPANENLNGMDGKGEVEPNTGMETQQAQHRAGQTLDAVTQALKQQAQANQQQQQQAQQSQQSQQSQPSPEEQQAAEAAAEVGLAQALQKQLRQDTGALDKQRAKNPNNALTPQQQKENAQIAEGQRNAQEITENAAQSLENAAPDAARSAREAGEHMDQAKGKLQQQQTGQPTQGQQDQALQKLDSAAKQAQQAMQQQQQQQQQQQASAQGAPKPGTKKGNKPGENPFARLDGLQRGAMSAPGSRNGKGFSPLSGRDQRSLREGGNEHVPAEYQDLVNRYYKSLAEQKR